MGALPTACLVALFTAWSGTATIAAEPTAALRAEGTEWVLQAPDGSRLRSADLVGAQIRLDSGALLRIDAVEPVRAQGRSWWAHHLSVKWPGKEWQPLCRPHSDGSRHAVVLPGRERADGSLAAEAGAFAISCTGGALAKCLAVGYAPWQPAPGSGTLLAAFNACVRMVRADYTGSGMPYTVDGRRIKVHDRLGIADPVEAPDQAFEAGWDEHGAVCVHHVRVAGKATLSALEERSARLRGNVGAVCTEAHARALGALVFNRSDAPETRR
ncbi:ADYC domain-containing protein [Piscinibacter sp. XHJ-5]|uniref:ADYC domain-containing protein n=1 Tax=Piscinibacter sp. XHJ-5 TaxID=3037797 RepID=UPI0024536907|nr:ADYC domain-containing protein [Piscinibacter sp. XHJ-5]